jgi:hypothetical protein
LAPYEVPQVFEFVKELPRSALGKLLKRELRKAPVALLCAGGDPATANGNGRHHGNGNGSANGSGNGRVVASGNGAAMKREAH